MNIKNLLAVHKDIFLKKKKSVETREETPKEKPRLNHDIKATTVTEENKQLNVPTSFDYQGSYPEIGEINYPDLMVDENSPSDSESSQSFSDFLYSEQRKVSQLRGEDNG